MANEIFLTSNEKFHVFSKSPITPSMGLAQAVNKSGHTTTTADVWSQDIPWFFSADDQATALVTGKDAKYNDLVLIGSNVFKRNKTAYSEGAAFGTLWEPFTLADKTKLYNSDEKHVLTYHKGVQVDFLTTGNNAKQASNYAGRIFINGKVVEQFVASTDKISGGVPSTGYGVAVYKSGSPLSEGEAEANFIANSYAGIIQFNTKVGPSTAYTADVFEYVGEKLSTTVSSQAADIKGAKNDISLIKEQIGLGNTGGDGTDSIGTRVETVEGKIETLETVTVPAIQESVTAAQTAAEKTAKDYTDGQITTVNGTITSTKTELEGKITAAETLANTKIKEVKEGTDSSLLTVSTSDDKVVTITLSGDVATKDYADTAAANAVSTGLAEGGNIATAIADAKKEALEAVEAIQHFSVSVVDSLPSPLVENTIYLVPEQGSTTGTYVEYIAYKPEGSDTVTTERIGTTAIDLKDYAKTADVTSSISAAQTTLQGNIDAVSATATGNAASIKTINETTIPAIQQSVTDGVAEAKSHAESKATEALNTAKGYTDSQITAELGEGGEIATKIAAAQSAAETTAATYTDQKIATELGETGSIGKAIEAAKQAAISQAEVTINQGTGIVVTGAGKGTTFTIAVDSSVATAQSVTDLTARVKANEDSLAAGGATALAIAGAASAAQAAQGTADQAVEDAAAALAEAEKRISKVSEGTDSGLLTVTTTGTEVTITLDDDVATKTHVSQEIATVNSSITTNVSTLEGKITTAQNAATAAQNAANTAQQTAEAKVASVTGPTTGLVTVKGEKEVTIEVSDTIATKDYADSKASAALTDAKTYTNTELGKLSTAAVQTVTGDTYVKATKTGTTVTLETQVSALDTALVAEGTSIATAIAAAKKAGTDAAAALESAKTQIGKDIAAAKSDVLGTSITTATGKDNETAPKVTVELSGTVQKPQLTVTTADIASAQELADLKQTVTDKNVTTSANAQAVGVTASNNTVDVDVATYTNKTWAKKANLVTGSVVESVVSDAKSDVLGATITTATGKDNETTPKVTVELSGSVQAPSLKVTTDDIASAKALSDLETKVDNFHKAGVSYQVLTDLPDAGKDYNGVIVLVPETTNDDVTAVAGSYVEHLCVNKGTEDAPSWAWEQIGTTKAEFANYYTKTEVDSAITTAIDALDSDKEGAGIKVELTNGKVTNVSVTSGAVEADNTSVVTGGVVHTAISTAITNAIDALDETTGSNGITLTQTNGIASITIAPGSVADGNTSVVTGGDVYSAVSVKANSSNVVASINGITNSSAVVLAVNESSAGTGLSIATEGENITITDSLITAWVPANATSVHCNVATVGDTQTLINPEKFTTTPESISNTITSWVADMPNLNNGKNMFYNCANLGTFIGDLSALENGEGMFNGCSSLMTFIGDLSALTNGTNMFYGCNLDIDYIEDIADSINDVNGSETTCVFDIGNINIPLEGNLTETVKQRYLAAIAKMTTKGWSVKSNGETPSIA